MADNLIIDLQAEVAKLREEAAGHEIKYLSVTVEFKIHGETRWRVYGAIGHPSNINDALEGPELRPVFDEVVRRIDWERTVNMKQIAAE